MNGTGFVDGDLPRMVLHESAITHNIELMRRFCESSGVSLAPHAKTHMSPELATRQLDAGAFALTAATTAQVRQLVGFGAPRVLHANVLVDRAAIRWVAATFLGAGGGAGGLAGDVASAGRVPDAAGQALSATPAPEYLCYVDSLAGLALLESELGQLHPVKPLRVLVEVGFTGGRTGTRSTAAALELGRAVSAAEWVELGGVAGFEGLMPLEGGAHPPGARELLRSIRSLAEQLHDEQLFAATPVVTAGGSSYFDLVVDELGPQNFGFEMRCVLRSGCYITHDHGVYERTSPFGSRAPSRPGSNSPTADAGADSPTPGSGADSPTAGAGADSPTPGSGADDVSADGSPAGASLDGSPPAKELFEPAFELLASVLSNPEPGLVIVGFGRREAPTDDRLPVVLGLLHPARSLIPAATAPTAVPAEPAAAASGLQAAADDVSGWEVFAVNDHHAFMRVPHGISLAPGTVLRFGISHPCGAFDRWRRIPLVDADYSVIGTVSPAL